MRRALVAVLLLPPLLTLPTAPEPAAAQTDRLSWLSAGDSFSSGTGIAGHSGSCRRSDDAYGHVAIRNVRDSGELRVGTPKTSACHGHLVEDLFNPRDDCTDDYVDENDFGCVPQLSHGRYDVIALSIGGNDLGFAATINDCIRLGDKWSELWKPDFGCGATEQQLNRRVDRLADPAASCADLSRIGKSDRYHCALDLGGGKSGSISDLYVKIAEEHLTWRGHLYIVGYPRLLAPSSEWRFGPGGRGGIGKVRFNCHGVKPSDADMLGRVARRLDEVLKTAVDDANDKLPYDAERVHYLSLFDLYRNGKHEVCGSGANWMHGIDLNWLDKDDSFHPHGPGHEAAGEELAKMVIRDFTRSTSQATFKSVSVGNWHSCGVRTNAAVVCWGDDSKGQASPPTGDFTAIAVGTAAGGAHSCAIRDSGTIACWGDDDRGEASPPWGTFTAIAAGGEYSCAIRSSGTVECWGDDSWSRASPPPGTFTAIAVGGSGARVHSCGIRDNGTVACWGNDDDGRASPPSGRFTAIAAGGGPFRGHSCGIRDSGTVECWGNDDFGQSSPPRGTFTAIAAGELHSCGVRDDGQVLCWGSRAAMPDGTFASVAAGGGTSCGVRTDGTIACWGDDSRGEASPPQGDNIPSNRPDDPPDTNETGTEATGTFSAVYAGHLHSCGLRTNGTVECWGNNFSGESDAPSGRFIAMDASAMAQHSCGLRPGGTVECWGQNGRGESNAPSGQFTTVSTGFHHSCGLRPGGTVECWGRNERGASDAPSGKFTAVSAGGVVSCGLRPGGTVECWGWGGRGRWSPPSGRFESVSTGFHHSCGLRPGGTVECWGRNGRGESDAPSGQFITVSAGFRHSCGLRPEGTLECWGSNHWSEGEQPDAPLHEHGQSDAPSGKFTTVSAGYLHSCGLRPGGAVECWGWPASGVLDTPSS